MEPNSGWHRLHSRFEPDQLVVGDQYQVMKRWETPIMERMAEILCASIHRTRIVEVGFGMGISAGALQTHNIERHTVIEPHPDIFTRLQEWRAQRADADICCINDYWQNKLDLFAEADGVFFDTYASSLPSLIEENINFLVEASPRLKSGAAVSTVWNLPRLDRGQQETLYSHYQGIRIQRVDVAPGNTGSAALARLRFALVAIK